MIPQSPTVLCGVSPILVVLTMKALIVPYGVSSHLIWPFKEWLILDLFQNLVHWFSEYCINCLGICRPCLPNKIPLRSAVFVLVRPEIPPLLRDNLSLSLPLLLVFLDPFILINSVHELAYTGGRLPSQRFP